MPFFVGLGFSLVLTPVALWVGMRIGLVDGANAEGSSSSDPLKIHTRNVPVLGGLAVVLATVIATIVSGGGIPIAVWVAALIALGTGLADDRRTMSAWTRLALLTAAGVLVAVGGLRLGPTGWIGSALVVGVVLACSNAVNLIDGQDGLAGGLAAIAALGLFLFGERASGLGLSLAGALVGFLVWNRPPARIFLGNGGAYAMGVLLGVLAAQASGDEFGRGLLVSGLCLSVFALELSSTVGRRLIARRPLMSGDRDHTYDIVARSLGGRARSTVVFYGLGLLGVGLAAIARSAPLVAVGAAAVVTAGVATGATRLARDRS